jgi:hypothetical protein
VKSDTIGKSDFCVGKSGISPIRLPVSDRNPVSVLGVHLLCLVSVFARREASEMSTYDWVFWLNVTNIGLGVIVVLAVLLVAYGIVWELVIRHKKHAGLQDVNSEMNEMLQNEFSHSLAVPELGLTMADGGERVRETAKKPAEDKKSK